MKKIIFVVLICLIPGVFCLEVSPTQLDFSGVTGEVICKDVFVSDFGVEVIGEDRWAVRDYDGRDFLAHKLDAFDLGLSVDYDENFFVEGESVKEVCLSGSRSGSYHGLLLYRGEGENAGVGIWIVVDLVGDDLIVLKGEVVEESGGNFVLALLIVLGIFLFIFLALLVSW